MLVAIEDNILLKLGVRAIGLVLLVIDSSRLLIYCFLGHFHFLFFCFYSLISAQIAIF